MIIACGPLGGGVGMVYAIGVSQPVQSWTVVRSHDDFSTLGQALTQTIVGIPPCPVLTDTSGSPSAVVKARNELQTWLNAILMFAGAQESQAVRNFLTLGVNTLLPQYENVQWTSFNTAMTSAPAAEHAGSPSLPSGGPVDDMEMDDMFLAGEDGGGANQEDQEDDDDDGFVPLASERYKQLDEAITDEDELDIMQGDVEMIEDIGSLAQSMGASHLGRSLNLQKELQVRNHNHAQAQPVQGLNIGGASPSRPPTAGGIGGAIAQAPTGDNFNRRPLESAPRLDSFKMIKVIGKGSFGKCI